jgi:7,8-dihydropterin-6-yl-methyl-4-(beta-D-ribofuranosyl)aminobenzene 5'-phosphate synthase
MDLRLKKAIAGILLALLFLVVFAVTGGKKKTNQPIVNQPMNEEAEISQSERNVSLITVFDNYQADPRLESGWGFSCLVRVNGRSLLFDTGADGVTLLSNMEKLAVDPSEIEAIFLSHIHGDHVGGLNEFLQENGKVKVYIPASFPDSMRQAIQSYGASFVDISGSTKIEDGIYSTGELGVLIKEQSMIVDHVKGLIIITGCAHPGIVEIVKKAKSMFPERQVLLVLGGFHLTNTSDAKLYKIIDDFKKLGVKQVAPCHCSGDRCRSLFQQAFEENFIENGVGKIIEI